MPSSIAAQLYGGGRGLFYKVEDLGEAGDGRGVGDGIFGDWKTLKQKSR